MRTTQKQASTRLFKKLSALRATLSNEERDILDSLIVVDDEVTAHQMKKGAVSKALSAKTARGAVAAAHQMKKGAVSKALSAKAANSAVAGAHQMSKGAVSKALSAKAAKGAVAGAHQVKSDDKVAIRIEFDPNSEEYKIQE